MYPALITPSYLLLGFYLAMTISVYLDRKAAKSFLQNNQFRKESSAALFALFILGINFPLIYFFPLENSRWACILLSNLALILQSAREPEESEFWSHPRKRMIFLILLPVLAAPFYLLAINSGLTSVVYAAIITSRHRKNLRHSLAMSLQNIEALKLKALRNKSALALSRARYSFRQKPLKINTSVRNHNDNPPKAV